MRRPFAVLAIVCLALSLIVVGALKSAAFSSYLKYLVRKVVPTDRGAKIDFDSVQVQFFPPGLRFSGLSVLMEKGNPLGMATGSLVEVRELSVGFHPFQAVSSRMRISKVRIVGANLTLDLDPWLGQGNPASKSTLRGLKVPALGDYLSFDVDRIELEDVKFEGRWRSGKEAATVPIEFLIFEPSSVTEEKSRLTVAVGALQKKSFPTLWPEIPGFPEKLVFIRAEADLSQDEIDLLQISLGSEIASLQAHGKIKNDVFDLSAQATAHFNSNEISGDLQFQGEMSGNLGESWKNIKIDGELTGQRVQLEGWKLGTVSLKGKLSKNSVRLIQGSFSAPKIDRLGNAQPGGGGTVEINPFSYEIGAARIDVPVVFKEAHIHWLMGPEFERVYLLDTRINGDAIVKVETGSNKPGSWKLEVESKLTMPSLLLDNQKFQAIRNQNVILDLKKVELKTKVLITESALTVQSGFLQIGSSELNVAGSVHFKKGFDLKLEGPCQFADLGSLARREIRGEGPLRAHVVGGLDSAHVIFDLDTKEAYYLNLAFGDLRGKIDYDIEKGTLTFDKMFAKRDFLLYYGGGTVDFDRDRVDMNLRVSQGDASNLLSIFSDLTKNFWWFPATLTGPIKGDVEIRGALDLDQMKILGKFRGEHLMYLRERIQKASFHVGLDAGTYFVDNFSSVKRNGVIAGRIFYGSLSNTMTWDIQTEDLVMTDWDRMARLDVPLRGRLSLQSAGSGKIGKIESVTHFRASELYLKGNAVPQTELVLKTHDGQMSVAGQIQGDQAKIQYSESESKKTTLNLELKELDFAPLLVILNPLLIQDESLLARISASIDLNYPTNDLNRLSGKVNLGGLRLEKYGSKFRMESPKEIIFVDGSSKQNEIKFLGPTGKITAKGKSTGGKLDSTITGDIDLTLVEFFTRAINNSVGKIQADIAFGGSLAAPEVGGRIQTEGALTKIGNLDTPFENIQSSISLSQNNLRIERVDGTMAGGNIRGDGNIILRATQAPIVDLKAVLDGPRLKVFPFQFLKLNGRLSLSGDRLPYRVDGKLMADSGLSTESFLQGNRIAGRKSARYTPQAGSAHDLNQSIFDLNLQVEANQNILIQNEFFDIEVKGALTILNTIDVPRVLGQAELIRGRLIFKDRVFSISNASAIFDNPSAINPKFKLTGNTEVSGTRVQLYSHGSAQGGIKVELSSNPAMTQPEILTLLALGLSPEELKKLSDRETGNIEKSQAASLVLHSLDFNRDLKNKTGIEFQMDEVVSNRDGASVFSPRTTTDSIASPRVVVKKQVGPVEFQAASTVGVGSGENQEFSAEMKLTPGFSVIGVVDKDENTSAQSTSNTSFGFDLKLQKRFK